MKQKDVALLVVVAIISGVFSFAITQFLFPSSKTRNLSIEKVETISSEFKQPTQNDPVFNKDAINPTQLIQIGDSNRPNPF